MFIPAIVQKDGTTKFYTDYDFIQRLRQRALMRRALKAVAEGDSLVHIGTTEPNGNEFPHMN